METMDNGVDTAAAGTIDDTTDRYAKLQKHTHFFVAAE